MLNLENNKALTWVEISKSSLLHNLNQLIRLAGKKAKICPIIKSNAYGHDITQTAKTLQNKAIWGFGVVSLDEALLLRHQEIRKPILVLSFAHKPLEEGIKKNVSFSLYSLDFARDLQQTAEKLKRKVNVHIKIDVGTSRLGLRPSQLIFFLEKISKFPHLNIQGIFAHLADSENKDWTYTDKQLAIFNQTISQGEKMGYHFPLKHIACSAAALADKNTHFNLVRLGIALYGLWPSKASQRRAHLKLPKLILQPVLTWRTKIIQIKNIPARTSIGYGRTFTAKKPMKLAILPVGYWDGYDRRLSNKGEVLINGNLCPIRGRICMNMTMVDVSKVNSLKVGDTAILLGKQGKYEISAETLAEKIGTINYEVVTRINPLLPRIFV